MDLEVYMRESSLRELPEIISRSQRPCMLTEAEASCHGDGASAGDGNPTLRSERGILIAMRIPPREDYQKTDTVLWRGHMFMVI